jgi:phosphate uptake regulator
MTESEAKRIIKSLERISNQLSTISEDVAYVVSREKASDQQQDEEVKKLREQSTHRHFGR